MGLPYGISDLRRGLVLSPTSRRLVRVVSARLRLQGGGGFGIIPEISQTQC